MQKTAEIIAIGSELLTPQRMDTNSLIITEQLNGLGVEVVGKLIIGDDRERVTQALRSAMERSNIVVVCGGLGPTEDDVTRDASLGSHTPFRHGSGGLRLYVSVYLRPSLVANAIAGCSLVKVLTIKVSYITRERLRGLVEIRRNGVCEVSIL